MRLLINADDYGLTKNVSRGIIDGIQNGLISSTSAIVCTNDFMDSAHMALEHGIYKMGLHCLASMGVPILPREQVATLVNEQGRFYSREGFMNKEICVFELEQEIEAQIAKLQSSGLGLSHFDTHHGFLCKNEEVFTMFIRLARKYQVPLRNEVSRLNTVKKDSYENMLKQNEIRIVEHVYFNHGCPHHTIEDIINYLNHALMKYETVEIGCHPGYSDDELRRLSVLNDDREIELDVMKSNKLKSFIQEHNIEIIDYDQL